MKEIHPLYASVIIFILSLVGAYVTFGILESSGFVKNEIMQLGGSIVGFVGIFRIFSRFYGSQMDKLSDSHNTLFLNLDMKKIKKNNKDFEADLDKPKCVAWTEDRKSSIKVEKEMIIVDGGGGWFLKIKDVEPEKTLNVRLVEINHREWEASISPYVQSISSIREVSEIK